MLAIALLLGPAVPLPQEEEASALTARRRPIKRLSQKQIAGCPAWVSLSGDALLTEWCGPNCAAGNCPEDKCMCGEVIASDGGAKQQALEVAPDAAPNASAPVAPAPEATEQAAAADLGEEAPPPVAPAPEAPAQAAAADPTCFGWCHDGNHPNWVASSWAERCSRPNGKCRGCQECTELSHSRSKAGSTTRNKAGGKPLTAGLPL